MLALGENRNPPAPHLRSPPQPARRWLRAGIGLPAGTHSWDLGPTCRARQEPALPSSCQAASPAGAFGVPGDGVQGRGRKLLPTQADSAWKCPGDGCSPRGVPSSLWSCSGHPQKELSPRQDSVSEVMAGWKTGRPLDSRHAKEGGTRGAKDVQALGAAEPRPDPAPGPAGGSSWGHRGDQTPAEAGVGGRGDTRCDSSPLPSPCPDG